MMSSPHTVGHGVLSQFNAGFGKDWFYKEDRRLPRSPEKRPFNPADSFYNPSTTPAPQPPSLAPIEQLHSAMPKSLGQMHQLLLTTQQKTKPKEAGRSALQPLPQASNTPKLPYLPTGSPKAQVQPAKGRPFKHTYRMGPCQRYNQEVHQKVSILSSRQP
ncbi:hypothetical protein DUNSADRAFT_11096 [Dunaliella salina]|uniref:Encoded protein n=1 Tax=Dunaliella salina TaxID=3046 RepID=A0ABQ7H4I6_DUNSA|nr:hypothetical protein DUNSADRAFT_11096 [Dunaliella salina]|eukprot:KAF5841780.1 hypothetical protein DUNSADRAFT_11096 [Dunaliella salina]